MPDYHGLFNKVSSIKKKKFIQDQHGSFYSMHIYQNKLSQFVLNGFLSPNLICCFI
jgi:hypothetical protein